MADNHRLDCPVVRPRQHFRPRSIGRPEAILSTTRIPDDQRERFSIFPFPAIACQTFTVQKLSLGDAAELAGDVGPDQRLIGVLGETAGRIELNGLRSRVGSALSDSPILGRRVIRHGRGTFSASWESAKSPIEQHVYAHPVCESLLRTCEQLFVEGIPDGQPMWRLIVLDDGHHDHLLFMAHHALLDGASAIPLIARLLDDEAAQESGGGARRPPRRTLPLGFLAGVSRGSSATSLLTPISSGFHLITVDVSLNSVRAAGHRVGATVNDVLLVAVASSIRDLAASRGERLHRVVLSVPVTGQTSPEVTCVRNAVGAFVVAVPAPLAGETSDHHLARLARRTKRRKALVRGFSAAPGFSLLLAGLGQFGWYRPLFEHQRAITSLVTNLRGPQRAVTVMGTRIVSFTPVSPAVGNVCLVFAALSYAGQLRISIRLDRSVWADETFLAAGLERAFARLLDGTHQF